jgi:hypothetical protein
MLFDKIPWHMPARVPNGASMPMSGKAKFRHCPIRKPVRVDWDVTHAAILTAGETEAILALDGGGMRGAFTLGFLGELESLIARGTENANNFVRAVLIFSEEPLRARSSPPVCHWAGTLRS